MNIAALFVALGGAILLSIFVMRRLRTKPWIEKGPIELKDGAAGVPAETVGLWVFLAVVTSLFSIFIIMYAERSGYPDWRQLPDPQLLWINTIFLVLGSVAFQMARNAASRDGVASRDSVASRGGIATLKFTLTAGGAFTIVFLVGQIVAWQELNSAGFYLATNPANTFFYLITGLHGLHLIGGLWVWAKTTLKVWRGVESLNVASRDGVANRDNVTEIANLRLSVQLCSVYWHFLLLLWLVLFYLFLTT